MANDERERARILRLFEEASSGEESTSTKDPFSDQDGEYGSDPNYDFENDRFVASSSGSDVAARPKRRCDRTLSKSSQSSDSSCTEFQELTAEIVSDSNQFITTSTQSTDHLGDQVNSTVTTTNDEDRPVSVPSTSRILSTVYLPSDNEWEDNVADIPKLVLCQDVVNRRAVEDVLFITSNLIICKVTGRPPPLYGS